MLESLNDTNIKKVTTKEPEKEPDVIFDPERDITAEDWGKIKERLDSWRNRAIRKGSDWSYFTTLAESIASLGHRGIIEISDDDCRNIKELFDSYRTSGYWETFVSFANEMLYITPNLELTISVNNDVPPIPEQREF